MLLRALCAASLLALLGCASSGGSDDAPAELPPGSEEARALVERFDKTVLDVAQRSRELGQNGREAELRPLAIETVDLPWVARASLGRYWDRLTPEQRAKWIETYREFHIVAMAFNWRGAQGARVEYLGEAPAPNGTVIVKTRLDRAGSGFDVRRDYRLRRTDEGWRIIDLFSPGSVSQVGMRRSEYLAVLARADFDALIQDMERRIATRRQQ